MKHLFTLSVLFFLCIQLVFATNGVLEPAYHAKRALCIPAIDGKPNDTCWNVSEWAPIDQVWLGQPVTPEEYTGSYKAIWTPERLYVLMKFIRSKLNDNYTGTPPCYGEMYNYDCAEIFIDENHSGGEYYKTYKAFAYHMMTNGHTCAPGPSGWDDRSTDITVVFDSAGNNTYYWEIELKVFDDTYTMGGNNTPVTLKGGKQMGFSIGYNTNNGGTTRKNMFGSHYIAGPDKNTSYRNASDLGDIILDDTAKNPGTALKFKKTANELKLFPNPAQTEINVSLENNNSGKYKLQVYNILGKEVLSMDLLKVKGLLEKKINLAALHNGVYILKLSAGNENYIQKFSVQ